MWSPACKKRLNLPTYRQSAVHTLGGTSARGPLLGARPAGRGCGRRGLQPTRAQPSGHGLLRADRRRREGRSATIVQRGAGPGLRRRGPGSRAGRAAAVGSWGWDAVLGHGARTAAAAGAWGRTWPLQLAAAGPGRSGAGTVALSRSCRRARTSVPVRLMRGLACPWL